MKNEFEKICVQEGFKVSAASFEDEQMIAVYSIEHWSRSPFSSPRFEAVFHKETGWITIKSNGKYLQKENINHGKEKSEICKMTDRELKSIYRIMIMSMKMIVLDQESKNKNRRLFLIAAEELQGRGFNRAEVVKAS